MTNKTKFEDHTAEDAEYEYKRDKVERTKQEEIRGAIYSYTDDVCLYPNKDCQFERDGYCLSDEDAYKCLMKRLDDLGVVIKVERKLLINPFDEDKRTAEWTAYELGKISLAGYVAVIPIKEVSNASKKD